MAFVYLDQGRFAYSQEVRLPGQPGTGVADAMGGRPDTDSADPRRLPCLHQRPLKGLGEARDRSEEEWGGVLQSGAGPAWWFCRKDLARQRSRLRTGRDDDSSGVWV